MFGKMLCIKGRAKNSSPTANRKRAFRHNKAVPIQARPMSIKSRYVACWLLPLICRIKPITKHKNTKADTLQMSATLSSGLSGQIRVSMKLRKRAIGYTKSRNLLNHRVFSTGCCISARFNAESSMLCDSITIQANHRNKSF